MNEGLEYLPSSLAQSVAQEAKRDKEKGGYSFIECSPHDTNAKCAAIQNELSPFNYDLQAWQLAHPEKMAKVWKEKYQEKEFLITQLENKISQTQQELQTVREQEADKVKKLARLESKITELEKTKTTLSQQTQTEFHSQDKSTQTEPQTLYQKFMERYDKK